MNFVRMAQWADNILSPGIGLALIIPAAYSYIPTLNRIKVLKTTFGLNGWAVMFWYLYATAQLALMANLCTFYFSPSRLLIAQADDSMRIQFAPSLRMIISASLIVLVLWLGCLTLLITYLQCSIVAPADLLGTEDALSQGTERQPSNGIFVDEAAPLLEGPDGRPMQHDQAGSGATSLVSLPQEPSEEAMTKHKQVVGFVCAIWTGACIVLVLIQIASGAPLSLMSYGDWSSLIQVLILGVCASILGWPSVLFALLSLYIQFSALNPTTAHVERSVLCSRTMLLQAVVFSLLGMKFAATDVLSINILLGNMSAVSSIGWYEMGLLRFIGLGLVYYRIALWVDWVLLGFGQLILLSKLLASREYEEDVGLWTMVWFEGKLRHMDE